MRRCILLLLALLGPAAFSRPDELPLPEQAWRGALQGDERALEAVEQFRDLLASGDLGALASRIPGGRVRLHLPEDGTPDGLYGPGQMSRILGDWLLPLRGRQVRITLAQEQRASERLELLVQWPPRSPDDPQPACLLLCELSIAGPAWTLIGISAP